MNRAQYLILCQIKREALKAVRDAKALDRSNEDPHRQYDWDAWMRAEGSASGLLRAVTILEAFIKAGK